MVIAALYSKRGSVLHARTRCPRAPHPNRLRVLPYGHKDLRKYTTCDECWTPLGYVVPIWPEMWELS